MRALSAIGWQFVALGKFSKRIAQLLFRFAGLAVQDAAVVDKRADGIVGHAEAVVDGAAFPPTNGNLDTGQQALQSLNHEQEHAVYLGSKARFQGYVFDGWLKVEPEKPGAAQLGFGAMLEPWQAVGQKPKLARGLHNKRRAVNGPGLYGLAGNKGLKVAAFGDVCSGQFRSEIHGGKLEFGQVIAAGVADLRHRQAANQVHAQSGGNRVCNGAFASPGFTIAAERNLVAAVREKEIAQADLKQVAVLWVQLRRA